MEIINYADRDMAVMGLADRMASSLRRALSMAGEASLAVPGGTTPGPVFDILSDADLAWERVTVMLTDERWVPEDHPRSNAALVRSRLLQGRAARAAFVPFYLPGCTVDEAAEDLSRSLAPRFPLSLLLLGMGEDMHTASLFPDAPELGKALDDRAPALCSIHPESQPESRITLTAPVLDGALEKHLLIFGDAKKHALEQARRLPSEKAPIAAVLQGGYVHWAP